MAKKESTRSALDNHNQVTANELHDILVCQLDAIKHDPSQAKIIPPLLIHGSPGIGKSTIVRDVCRERGIEFIDVRLAQMEPCDIRGLPVPNKEKKVMEWFVNGSWPNDPNSSGILFLDEITSCDKSIAVAAYELVLDRRLGTLYKVPDNWYIVAAGNLVTDSAVATTMPSALANRFMHVELRDDQEAWLTWARHHNVHPSVIGFIQYKPNMLFDMDDQNLERGWPSPRSWERVSQMCHICSNESLLRKMVYGLVGNGAGVEFMAFHKLNEEFANILDIMRNPKSVITIPDRIDKKCAMCAAMVYLLWRGKDDADTQARVNGFLRICMKLTPDFSTMAMQAAMEGLSPEKRPMAAKLLTHNPEFKNWQKIHRTSLNVKV